jgi:HAD superfamily hydrolase (TIGR01509 family)
MAPSGVLLDIDGTLILSNDLHARAWVDSFAVFGYQIAYDDVRPLIGMGGDQIIPKFAPGLNSKEGEGKEISDYRKQLVINEFTPQMKPANGARALIQKMQDAGLNLIVATSASNQELEHLLKAAQIEDLLTNFTTSSDAKASKPQPDIVQVALDKIHLSSGEVVMIADTPYDIEAGKKAGVGVIAFRCGGFSEKELAGAIAIYNDPADLLQHYEESPLAKHSSTPATV